MKYELNSCNNCGSEIINKIREEQEGENTLCVYKCSSCGFVITAKAPGIKPKEEKEVEPNNATGIKVFSVAEKNVFPVCATSKNGHVAGSMVLIGGGYGLTNAHVVLTASDDNIMLNDDLMVVVSGNTVEAEVIKADTLRDLALIKIDSSILSTIKFGDYNEVKTGQKIFAVGNSLGSGISITDGIISDKLREVGSNKFTLISAPINKGSSGGALFNEDGEIIGVLTAAEQKASLMNYAVPIDVVYAFIKKAEVDEEITILLNN